MHLVFYTVKKYVDRLVDRYSSENDSLFMEYLTKFDLDQIGVIFSQCVFHYFHRFVLSFARVNGSCATYGLSHRGRSLISRAGLAAACRVSAPTFEGLLICFEAAETSSSARASRLLNALPRQHLEEILSRTAKRNGTLQGAG